MKYLKISAIALMTFFVVSCDDEADKEKQQTQQNMPAPPPPPPAPPTPNNTEVEVNLETPAGDVKVKTGKKDGNSGTTTGKK